MEGSGSQMKSREQKGKKAQRRNETEKKGIEKSSRRYSGHHWVCPKEDVYLTDFHCECTRNIQGANSTKPKLMGRERTSILVSDYVSSCVLRSHSISTRAMSGYRHMKAAQRGDKMGVHGVSLITSFNSPCRSKARLHHFRAQETGLLVAGTSMVSSGRTPLPLQGRGFDSWSGN